MKKIEFPNVYLEIPDEVTLSSESDENKELDDFLNNNDTELGNTEEFDFDFDDIEELNKEDTLDEDVRSKTTTLSIEELQKRLEETQSLHL